MPKLRILLAEVHPDSREVTALILSRSGFEVVAVSTGSDTLTLAQQSRFDLVVLDHFIADMLGIEVCHKIRESIPNLPIVFYSGAAFEADKQKAMSCGAQAYVTKPDGIFTLPETLHKVISQRKN